MVIFFESEKLYNPECSISQVQACCANYQEEAACDKTKFVVIAFHMISKGLVPAMDLLRSKRSEEEARMAKEEKLLKSKDVAHILDCSPDDVHVLVHRGDLKGTKVGRFWRYRLEDVMEYKRRMEKKGP